MDNSLIDGKMIDLNGIEKDCWYRLVNGGLRGRDSFHWPVVGNQSAQGVQMRTVVLRKALSERKQLYFYTDTRSGKWTDLEQNPSISWLFYDPATRVQIRISGTAYLHYQDEIAKEEWKGINAAGRTNYQSALAPSTKIESPGNSGKATEEKNSTAAAPVETGWLNFGVVETQVKWMEWLLIGEQQHLRASFSYDAENNCSASWLVP